MLPGGGGSAAFTIREAVLVETKVPEIVTVVGATTVNPLTVKFALN